MFNRTLGRFTMKRSSLIILLGIFFILALTSFHIGSATKGLSPAEVNARAQVSNIHMIYDSPINAVHKLFLYGFEKIDTARHSVTRLPSYLFALIFAGCF